MQYKYVYVYCILYSGEEAKYDNSGQQCQCFEDVFDITLNIETEFNPEYRPEYRVWWSPPSQPSARAARDVKCLGLRS